MQTLSVNKERITRRRPRVLYDGAERHESQLISVCVQAGVEFQISAQSWSHMPKLLGVSSQRLQGFQCSYGRQQDLKTVESSYSINYVSELDDRGSWHCHDGWMFLINSLKL